MGRKSTGVYPDNWHEIANAVKTEAGWQCARCNHRHDPEAGYCLTVHHADMNPSNNRWFNLLPLCQRCHLTIQARVVMDRPWVMFDHSDWFKPYVAAFYAFKYLGEDLTRDETLARLDDLLMLEKQALGVAS